MQTPKPRSPFFRLIENRYVRSGNYFFAGVHDDDTDTSGVFKALIKSPNTTIRCSLVARISVSSASKLSVVEGPTVSNAGTAVSAINANRTSATTATAVVTHTPTSSGGTTLAEYQLGAGEEFIFGSNSGYGLRLLLNQNTYYEFQVTAQSDNTKISINFEWIEE